MLASELGGGRLSERASEEGYYTDAPLQTVTRRAGYSASISQVSSYHNLL